MVLEVSLLGPREGMTLEGQIENISLGLEEAGSQILWRSLYDQSPIAV